MLPWVVIQVYLGNKVYRNGWDSPNEYIHLASWLPTQEDIMACDWKQLISWDHHTLGFDLTLGAGNNGYFLGYAADHVLEGMGLPDFGTLNVIENQTDIAKISLFYWNCYEDEYTPPSSIRLQGSSDKNEDSYQKMIELLKKDLYVTVDGVTYNLGVPLPYPNNHNTAYTYRTWYQYADVKKLGAVMEQTGKTKRFYFNWR
ncbi:hypothetical protein [Xenorhabdus bovienii]|uniref:DUF7823 domain-containing protein n=1 Tax=Xenorhabdus bovienii TaxID=40576 RepID=UPI00237CACB3|nr:hypothetical protein [Xenorhabdus bovienii]MDE1483617.1 DUF2829 domain-containing protein [Xenorhabdus bovienii]MDE9442855.1 DUF2829 domain-containing protein [Xenorhabdus bovienii]